MRIIRAMNGRLTRRSAPGFGHSGIEKRSAMSVLTMSVLTNSGWTIHARRIAFAGALGLAVLAAFHPASALAQDDDEDDKKSGWNFDKKILNDLMRSLGMRNGGE